MNEIVARLIEIESGIADLRAEKLWLEVCKLLVPFLAGSCVPVILFLWGRAFERSSAAKDWFNTEFIDNGTRLLLVGLMDIQMRLPYVLYAPSKTLELPELQTGAMSRFREVSGSEGIEVILWVIQARMIARFKSSLGEGNFPEGENGKDLRDLRIILDGLREFVTKVQGVLQDKKVKSRTDVGAVVDKDKVLKWQEELMGLCMETLPDWFTEGHLSKGAKAEEVPIKMQQPEGG